MNLKTYKIREGSIDWGNWAAATAEQAIAILLADAESNPDRYCGQPDPTALTAREL